MDIKIKKFGLRDAFVILAIVILIPFLAGLFINLLPIHENFVFLLSYTLGMAVAAFLVLRIYNLKIGKFSINIKIGYLKLIPLIVLLPILMQLGITSHIVNFIPMPEWIEELNIGENNHILTVLTVVLIAPILEEFVFRGIVLKGLLGNYNTLTAIIISSFIFGIVHLNPWQFVGAFGIGLINGWLYWKTKNLMFPVIVHISNNVFFTIIGVYFGSSYLIDKPLRKIFGEAIHQLLGVSISVVLMVLVIMLIGIIFKSSDLSRSGKNQDFT